MKWAKANFEILIGPDPGYKEEVGGYTWECWGVHKDSSRTWSLTHLPTGRAITAHARTKLAARDIAEKLNPLADWRNSVTRIRRDSTLYKKVYDNIEDTWR